MKDHKLNMSKEGRISQNAVYWIRRAVDLIIPPVGNKHHIPYKGGRCVPTHSSCFQRTKARGGNHREVVIEREGLAAFPGLMDNFSKEQFKKCSINRRSHQVIYHSLPEPGKYRIITKGPANLYTGVRPFQRFILNCWKRSRFGTMSPDFEHQYHERMFRDPDLEGSPDDGESYCSADYDAATDKLKMQATQVCIDRILANLGWSFLHPQYAELYMCVKECLAPAIIWYPDGEILRQKGGQLMGNPLSFPLLCIINLSCYMRLRRFPEKENWRYMRTRMFVNGDDIVFRGSEEDFRLFKEFAGDVGLVINTSKTYIHKKYYLLNSVLGIKGSTVGYYNRALALGHRVKSEPLRLISQARLVQAQLLEGNPPEFQKKLMSIFYRTLRTKMGQIIPNTKYHPSYFLPKRFGGLGLQELSGKQFYLTNRQRAVATYLLQNPHEAYFMEKAGNEFQTCKKALELFKRLGPPTRLIRNEKLAEFLLIGPNDYTVIDEKKREQLLLRCLSTFAWSKESCVDVPHTLRVHKKLPEKMLGSAMSSRDILSLTTDYVEVIDRCVPQKRARNATFKNNTIQELLNRPCQKELMAKVRTTLDLVVPGEE
jgi:hypothetical protein